MKLFERIRELFAPTQEPNEPEAVEEIHGHPRPEYKAYFEVIGEDTGKYTVRIYGYADLGNGLLEEHSGNAVVKINSTPTERRAMAEAEGRRIANIEMQKYRRDAE